MEVCFTELWGIEENYKSAQIFLCKKNCSMIINQEFLIYEEDSRSQCKDFIFSTSRKYVCCIKIVDNEEIS